MKINISTKKTPSTPKTKTPSPKTPSTTNSRKYPIPQRKAPKNPHDAIHMTRDGRAFLVPEYSALTPSMPNSLNLNDPQPELQLTPQFINNSEWVYTLYRYWNTLPENINPLEKAQAGKKKVIVYVKYHLAQKYHPDYLQGDFVKLNQQELDSNMQLIRKNLNKKTRIEPTLDNLQDLTKKIELNKFKINKQQRDLIVYCLDNNVPYSLVRDAFNESAIANAKEWSKRDES